MESRSGDHIPPIFDDADPADLGTVDEQAEYRQRWHESVFGPHTD